MNGGNDNKTNTDRKAVIQAMTHTQCYGIDGGTDIDRKDTSPQRGGTWEYDNTKYQPPLYHNVLADIGSGDKY